MRYLFLMMISILWISPAAAQDLSALARLDAGKSSISETVGSLDLSFAISQPVPWRVRLLDNPPRLVLDMREVDWTGVETIAHKADLRAGGFRPGWSRLVLMLGGPMRISSAEMQTQADTRLVLRLEGTDQASFATAASAPEPPEWALPRASDLPAALVKKGGPLIVVIDPGHGGIDPGAEREGQNEANLVLTFARELKEALLRDGGFQVVMTRESDVFVPLETRISVARAVGADVFLSLHADARAEGEATGATVYKLAARASDAASEQLAERHDRADLLAGVDLAGNDDQVADVLMDLARQETQPRADHLALALKAAIQGKGLKMHRHPIQEAAFSVLKSADIPSVLLEVGFLSSKPDRVRLVDPKWRADLQAAILAALQSWAVSDAAEANLIRK